jgi:hypothetical protein
MRSLIVPCPNLSVTNFYQAFHQVGGLFFSWW